MASITFRFTTECEITLEGCSHQEAYLRFKDLCQQKKAFNPRNVTPPVTPFDGPSCHVYPPEQNTVMFEIDEQNQFSSMTMQGANKKKPLTHATSPHQSHLLMAQAAMYTPPRRTP